MHVTLSPFWAYKEEPLTLEKQGDTLVINGVSFDFSVLPKGSTLPDGAQATGCDYITGPIERSTTGAISLTLRLPHGRDAAYEARFPEPLEITRNGPVALPDVAYPEPEPEPMPEPEPELEPEPAQPEEQEP